MTKLGFKCREVEVTVDSHPGEGSQQVVELHAESLAGVDLGVICVRMAVEHHRCLERTENVECVCAHVRALVHMCVCVSASSPGHGISEVTSRGIGIIA